MRLAFPAALLAPIIAGIAVAAGPSVKVAVFDLEPSWSPDGSQIVFVRVQTRSEKSGFEVTHADIYVARADGSRLHRLTRSGWNHSPAWLPNGKAILVARASLAWFDDTWGPVVRSGIYTLAPTGGPPRLYGPPGVYENRGSDWFASARVAPVTRRLAYVFVDNRIAGLRGTPAEIRGNDPEWSPNGAKLAFTARALETVDADGTNRRVLFDRSIFEGRTCDPSWSPNGTRIVFSHGFNICGDELAVVNASGGGFTSLVRNGSDPAWSPGGGQILFVRNRHLYVMHSNGTEVRRVRLRPGS